MEMLWKHREECLDVLLESVSRVELLRKELKQAQTVAQLQAKLQKERQALMRCRIACYLSVVSVKGCNLGCVPSF